MHDPRGWVGLIGVLTACVAAPPPVVRAPPEPPAVSGSALLINVNPTNAPRLLGNYDFELLEQGTGKACVNRNADAIYWVGMNDISALASDGLTRSAIAAAALDAVSQLEAADTILLTSIKATAEGDRSVCATVRGRAVRLTKARWPAPTVMDPTLERPDAGE